jgi:uncharacterized membrane protein
LKLFPSVILVVLLLLVVVLGPAITQIPQGYVQLVLGTLLLLFGLRWLRRAVLRAAGVVPFHDEAKAYAEESVSLRYFDEESPRGCCHAGSGLVILGGSVARRMKKVD